MNPFRKKRRSIWISVLFLLIAAIFLGGWFVYWEAKHQGLDSVGTLVGRLPVNETWGVHSRTLGHLADELLSTNGEERIYLVLFQNNLELRPGGGFIGSFGILKIRDGHVTEFTVHDTGIFDGRIPNTVQPPYPMRETLDIDSWKLRDSNWSPDFPTNAKKAVEFYKMGGGEEAFDGVVGITADVLSSVLSVTGPVSVPGFPGEYDAENGVFDLEYQVEQAYIEQDIPFSERKSVLGILGSEILKRVRNLPPRDLLRLAGVVLEDLKRKDIQLYFIDETLGREAAASEWDGSFDNAFAGDFLMIVDANLDAWKTDSVMERSFRYEVDFSSDIPHARLMVAYRHAGFEKNFMVKDYQSVVRVYVPDGSWFRDISGGATEPVYGEFMGRKYVGTLVQIPLGETREIVFEYDLPEDLEREYYDLKIMRQPGTKDIPTSLAVISPNGSREERDIILDEDFILGDYSKE